MTWLPSDERIEMSWLNTASFASLAKNALREAQKTIDKALDIKENVAAATTANNVSIGKEIDVFFQSFGLGEDEEAKSALPEGSSDGVIISEPASNSEKEHSGASQNISGLWGSFTGSFFDLNSVHQTSAEKTDENVSITEPSKLIKLETESKDPEVEISTNEEWDRGWESQVLLVSPSCTENSAVSFQDVSPSLEYLSPPQSSPDSVIVLSMSSSLQSGISTSSVEVIESVESKVESSCVDEESSINESFHSSASASSSLTVISPDNEAGVGRNDSDSTGCLPVQVVEDRAVSSLLADAIGLSLKGESDHRSASVSGDEIETTTSSDIEIIASPQAGIRKILPMTLERINQGSKTHHREPSEASSEDSITSAMELEKMTRKISELSQLLEARENKLLEMNRNCSALTEEVEQLRDRLAQDEKERNSHSEAVRRMTEDFSQRLSAVEKRYQQVVVEKEALSKQLDSIKVNQGLSDQLQEKEEIIRELMQEGEKLSKQQLQQSNIIKKLRSKEKEDEQQFKIFKEKNEELSREMDRLKKNLSAKEELERNQIEAVRQLTAANGALDKELVANKLVMMDALSETESLRSSLESVTKELADLKAEFATRDTAETERTLSAEVALRQKMQMEFEALARQFNDEKSTYTSRLEELGRTLAQADEQRSKEREQNKSELSRLMQRLQEAEARSDELSQALTASTRPLLRQIESLQHSLTSQRLAEEKSEKVLEEKLRETQAQLQTISDKETSTRDMYLKLQSKTIQLEEQVSNLTREKNQLLAQFETEKLRNSMIAESKSKEILGLEFVKKGITEELQTLREKLRSTEQALEMETAALETEKKKSFLLQEQLTEKERKMKISQLADSSSVQNSDGVPFVSRGSSPTSSLDKISMSGSLTESFSSNPWISTDEVFEGGLATPVPRSTLYDSLRAGSNTAVFESLQSQLKTREGEVLQLQLDLQNQERTRDSLTQELTKLISSNQEMSQRLSQLETLQNQFGDLQTKYNALLQLYGEKIEENEELKLDLADVKEMYKAQIDQLLKT